MIETSKIDTLKKEELSIADFAKLSRTSRSTLLFYDKIGLLSPVSRKDNNYRYYNHTQLAIVNVIRICRALGMSLDEIKQIRKKPTQEALDEVYEHRMTQIDEKIDTWIRARKLLTTLRNIIHPVLDMDETAITVEHVPAEPIVLGRINDYSDGQNDYNALAYFYSDCMKKYPNLDLNYPVWAMFSEERIRSGNRGCPDRYYFFNPDGYDKRPAALYAIGYIRGGYGHCGPLYDRVIAYIDANGYEICGPAYEEYPLNELSFLSAEDYLIRLMITVRKKRSSVLEALSPSGASGASLNYRQ